MSRGQILLNGNENAWRNTENSDAQAHERQNDRPLPSWLIRVLKFGLKICLVAFIASLVLVLLFKWVAPPTSSFMMQKMLAGLFSSGSAESVHYQWVGYDEISSYAKIAVVAEEDQNFPNHSGFDFEAIEKAWNQSKKGKRLRGASTISQQVAKNLFLWPGRSYFRKALEAYFTVLIEAIWSKQRILEVYLNIAQMGEWVFGVGAASEIYFHVPASRLSRQQSALLAAVLPNPERYSVSKPSSYVRYRQRWILKQMSQLGGTNYLDEP